MPIFGIMFGGAIVLCLPMAIGAVAAFKRMTSPRSEWAGLWLLTGTTLTATAGFLGWVAWSVWHIRLPPGGSTAACVASPAVPPARGKIPADVPPPLTSPVRLRRGRFARPVRGDRRTLGAELSRRRQVRLRAGGGSQRLVHLRLIPGHRLVRSHLLTGGGGRRPRQRLALAGRSRSTVLPRSGTVRVRSRQPRGQRIQHRHYPTPLAHSGRHGPCPKGGTLAAAAARATTWLLSPLRVRPSRHPRPLP